VAWALGVLGFGMGLAMAPATDSIMGSLPTAKAGVGSAMNTTTRQVGGTLGVAVLGSVLTSAYRDQLARPRRAAGLGRRAGQRLGRHRTRRGRLARTPGGDLSGLPGVLTLCRSAPSPAQPDSHRLRGSTSSGKEALDEGVRRHGRPSQALAGRLLDHDGTQLLNRNLPNAPAELTAVLGQLEPGTPVAFEAACGWGWLAELLGELGLEPHLVHPSRCKAIASARLKDDKVDARTLAHLLRADLLPEAWLAPQAVRDQRALLRHRAALVRMATMLKNRIHAVLADRGIRVPARLWTTPGRTWLADLDLPAVQRRIVDDGLALIDQLTPVVARLERDLLAQARPDLSVQALMALPGIGEITAMTLVAEIGDLGRFPTARKLCAWAGLTPAVHNPDRKVRHGHITSRAHPGCAGCLMRRPTRPRAAHRSPTSTPSAPPAAGPRSPPWRLPASSSLARSMF
jgi:transposase